MATYIVLAHRGDGNYQAKDAVGARYFKRESAAEKFAQVQNSDSTMMAINPRGYVVRSSTWFRTDGVEFLANGRIYMAERQSA